ncbi:hypothetical protein [Microvirga splendida]|uniref:DUF4398 domain-containing protein n=1 Tax=Microvirga splendida TaxID=2795727 RepID=A0ABS0Y4A6_9HYPH|nr:hypothetical protein [Microvirga splendida]MBJ6127138.1 hypothetical protein [Microvirga splendida]
MPLQRHLRASLLVAALPLLPACTQTAAPVANAPEAEETGIMAAIQDAQRTQARHKATSAVLGHASALDPTGLSGFAIDALEEQQERIEEEKYRRIDEEVEKAIAEGMALQARSEALEQKAGNTRPGTSRRKPNP